MPVRGHIRSFMFQGNDAANLGEVGTTTTTSTSSTTSTTTPDPYGAELHTSANAASDPNGNEANATTGWGEAGLNGTGANVFESQAGVKNVGSFAFHMDASDTPSANARIFVDLEAAPYNFVNTEEGIITVDLRHTGTGPANSNWTANLGSSDLGVDHEFANVIPTDATFQTFSIEWTHDATHRYFNFRERNGSNNGGMYVDNISVRKGV